MLRNNNKKIIKKLAVKHSKVNIQKNIFTLSAIVLTAFLICIVFSIGAGYVKSSNVQQIQFAGTKANTLLTNPNEDQINFLKKDTDVIDIGLVRQIGVVDVSNYSQIDNAYLRYVDNNEWNFNTLPALANVKGKYPENANEIIVPVWVLNEIGIDKPELGMKFNLKYRFGYTDINYGIISDEKNADFILSGWYEDNSSNKFQKNGILFVSKAFWKNTEVTEDNTKSVVEFTYNGDFDDLVESLNISSNQEINIIAKGIDSNKGLLLILAVVLFAIVLCGYLLIYNIFYISIANDIQYYGQLKTLGMTKRQIKKMLYYQILRLCIIGIPIGLLLSNLIAYWIVPSSISKLQGKEAANIVISNSPWIYVGATLFVLLTVFISVIKPASIAGNISPIEATKYTNINPNILKKNRRNGNKLYIMALRNMQRNKKATILTFTSLFLGMVIFLISNGIFESLNMTNLAEQYLSDDILVYKDNASNSNISIDEIEKIKEISGVQGVGYLTLNSETVNGNNLVWINNDNHIIDDYVAAFVHKFPDIENDSNMIIGNSYKTRLIGVGKKEFERIEKYLNIKLDYNSFCNGEFVILGFVDWMDENIKIDEKVIHVNVNGSDHTWNVVDKPIPSNFEINIMNYVAPNIFISKEYLADLPINSEIYQISIDTESGGEYSVLDSIKELFYGKDVTIESRYEKAKDLEESFQSVYLLGTALSIMLLFIGIMNYINSMCVNIINRKHEFATLESIGMTQNQIKRMITYESVYYVIGTSGLVLSFGTLLVYFSYAILKRNITYAKFSYPILEILLMICFVFVLCIVVSNIMLNKIFKVNLVDRLRE